MRFIKMKAKKKKKYIIYTIYYTFNVEPKNNVPIQSDGLHKWPNSSDKYFMGIS